MFGPQTRAPAAHRFHQAPHETTAPPAISPGPGKGIARLGGWIALALVLFGISACTTLSERSGENPLESEAYGVWAGRLPCAGCPGVDTRLVLWRNPDFFRLTETYLDTGGGPKTFTSFGRWNLEKVGKTPELGRLNLTTDDARRTLYLERLPDGSLRMLNHNGDAGEPEADYVLERTRARAE